MGDDLKLSGLDEKLLHNQRELKRNGKKLVVLSLGCRDACIHAAGAN